MELSVRLRIPPLATTSPSELSESFSVFFRVSPLYFMGSSLEATCTVDRPTSFSSRPPMDPVELSRLPTVAPAISG